MYDFNQDWFRNSGITENNDGCYEAVEAGNNFCIIGF